MHVPPWLPIAVAVFVIAFGLYRIRLALKPADPDPSKQPLLGGGFYKMGSRTHLVIGVVYLLLGAALVATAFGWSPFARSDKTEAPIHGGIPVGTGSAR